LTRFNLRRPIVHASEDCLISFRICLTGAATCSSRFRDHFIAADDSGAVGLPLASAAGNESRSGYSFARE